MKNKTGSQLILEERTRQITREGFGAPHDDAHRLGEIAIAAACYALPPEKINEVTDEHRDRKTTVLDDLWPWEKKWWKPSPDPIRNLVKAGALIAAEIDRIQRLKP